MPARARPRLVRADGHDSTLQLVTSLAVIIVSVLTVQPRAWTGAGLATMLLLALNCGLLITRHVPARLIGERSRIVLLGAGAVAAAALLALATSGSPYLFAFFVAGHAGYRLSADRAVPVALACSALSAGVLLLHIGPGHRYTPWLVGAAAGFSVLLGMVNRTRAEALGAALAAAESAERAAESEAREAVLAERGRIARDVHDVLAHSLAGINMQLEVADAMLDAGDLEQVRRATSRAQSLVRESMLESQRTVRALREDTLPLLETLRSMLDSAGPTTHLEVTGPVRSVETRPAQALVRIAQESLTNAAKHAPGSAVTVTVGYEPDVVILEVINDAAPITGTGPITGAGLASGSGMGLVGMRERAALLNGSVTAGPIAQGPHAGGWQVRAIITA